MLLSGNRACAAEWTAEPSITVAAGVDDNATLTTAKHDSVSVWYVAPRAKFSRATETSNLNLDVYAIGTKYSGDQVNDTNEQVLALSSTSQATERSRWGIGAELRRDFLFEPSSTGPGTGGLQDTDVGLTEVKVRRRATTFQPSWQYALSERSSLQFRYRLWDVEFEDVAGTDLVDYRDHSLEATYTRVLTPKDALNIAAGASAYRPDEETGDADTVRLRAGVARAFTETLRGMFLVGASKTTENTSAGDKDASGWVFEAGLEQQSELTTLNGVISRDIQPSGAGRAVRSDQLRLSLDRKLSPKTELRLRANMFRNEVVEGAAPEVDRRYVEVIPEFLWQWAPQWFTGLGYVYRREKFDANPESAESNAVYLSVAYEWQRFALSR